MTHTLTYLKARGGYATMREMKRAAIQTREIANLLKDGEIEKIRPGLYRLANYPKSVPFRATLIDVCQAMPRGVICLLSALDFHELTTFNPSEVYVAIPHAQKPRQVRYPPIRSFFFRERSYSPGIVQVETRSGTIKVYNKEKTICDMFRYRDKLGEDLALEALKTYLRTKAADLHALQKYAAICQVKTVLTPYLKAMSA